MNLKVPSRCYSESVLQQLTQPLHDTVVKQTDSVFMHSTFTLQELLDQAVTDRGSFIARKAAPVFDPDQAFSNIH